MNRGISIVTIWSYIGVYGLRPKYSSSLVLGQSVRIGLLIFKAFNEINQLMFAKKLSRLQSFFVTKIKTRPVRIYNILDDYF